MGQARAAVEHFYGLFAAGKFAESTALFDPDSVTTMPSGVMTPAEHEAMGQAFKAAFHDARADIDRCMESGEEVFVLGRFRGTHTGDLHSPDGLLPASGKSLNLRFIDYFRVTNGLIVEQLSVFDRAEMLAQIAG